MNEAHQHCGSDEWRAMIRDVILPWAMGEVDLGDDVLEVGPGYGATTDVLSTKGRTAHVGRDRRRARGDAHRAVRRACRPSRSCGATPPTLTYPDGRFTGAACFTMLHHVPSVELQDRLFAEVARVLQPGAALVASDSLASAELEAHHEGDTYNPVDPDVAAGAAPAAGFADVEVRTNPFGWAAVARTAAVTRTSSSTGVRSRRGPRSAPGSGGTAPARPPGRGPSASSEYSWGPRAPFGRAARWSATAVAVRPRARRGRARRTRRARCRPAPRIRSP